MPNRGQLQPAHTPPRACCRPRLCVPACHMSPGYSCAKGCTWEFDARPNACQQFQGDLYQCPTGISLSLCPASQPHNICAGEGSLAHHPALYHVICYPTIYNCIKTHTRELDLSRWLFPATYTMDSALPSILHPTVRYNFMLCLTFCTFFSVSHFVGASLPVPNLILDWLTYYCVSFTFAWFMNF